MANFPVTELFRNFEPDATPPSEHHFSLSQDVTAGSTLIYLGGSTVGSTGVPTPTTLNGGIDASQTTLVTASAFFNTAASVTDGYFMITIDSEDMLVTAGKATTTLTVQRAFNGTTAATHSNGATVTGYDGGVNRIDPIGGGTWRPVVISPKKPNTGTSEIWTCYCPTSINHLTTTVGVLGFQRGVSPNCRIISVPGQLTLDKVAVGSETFGTAHTTGNITTTTANELLVAVHEVQRLNGWTPEVVSPVWSSVTTDNATDGNFVAFHDREVTNTGTYESSGTATNPTDGTSALASFSDGPAGQVTGICGLLLSPVAKPDTLTGFEIHSRARKANPSEAGVLRHWLYESSVLRSGPWDTALTDNFVTSTVRIPDADSALIGHFGNLELRIQGVAPSGAITPQVSFIELQVPGSSILDYGSSNFPAFELPASRATGPGMFRPGALDRSADELWFANYTVPVSGVVSPAAISATSSVSASLTRLAAVAPAAVNASSTVTASVTVIRSVRSASASATSTVTASLRAIRAVKPAAINATSTITAGLVVRWSVHAAISATSTVSASVSGGNAGRTLTLTPVAPGSLTLVPVAPGSLTLTPL